MKKLLFLLILIIIIYGIYALNHTDKITYLSIGDSLSLGLDSSYNTNYGYSTYIANYLKEKNLLKTYNNSFSTSNAKIKDLLNDIKINKTITKDNESLNLKKCLRESSLVTLSIGMEDIKEIITLSTNTVEKVNNEQLLKYTKEPLENLDELLKEIRKYAKDEVIMVGYYNPFETSDLTKERIYNYFIEKTKEITSKYDIEYLDIYKTFKINKEYLHNPTCFYPTTKGYEVIGTKIIEKYLQNS